MSPTPKTIVVTGLDQMITVSGICVQDTTPSMRPGMPIKIKPGGAHNEFMIEDAIFSDFQPANKAIVLDDISRGIGVDYAFSAGEAITVAYLTPGVVFWGRINDSSPDNIDIGDYLTLPYSPSVEYRGTFSKWKYNLHLGVAMFGISLTKRLTGAEDKWVTIRYSKVW